MDSYRMDRTIQTHPIKKVQMRATIPKKMVILELNALYSSTTAGNGVEWVQGEGRIQHGKEYLERMKILEEPVEGV